MKPKFSLWTNYGALNSKPVFDAFQQSLAKEGYRTVHNSYEADVFVIWSVLFNGRMAGNEKVWQYAKTFDKPVIVLEVGGIKRGTTWKVGLNGINRDAFFGDAGNDSRRSDLLGLRLKPWQEKGKYILLCGQHDKSLQWKNMPRMSQWVIDTIETVQSQTDKPIIFRPHPRCPLPHIENEFKNVVRQDPKKLPGTYDDYDIDFSQIAFTISWSSNPGIHSIINGIPAYTGPSSLAYPLATQSLHQLNNPTKLDRRQWLNEYAWTEYTIDEISRGIPLKRLTSKLF